MTIYVSDIVYKEKTREWKINLDTISSYKQYLENPLADHSIWRFNDFAEFNSQPITGIQLNVPFDDLDANFSEIYSYVLDHIKKYTTREVESFKITAI